MNKSSVIDVLGAFARPFFFFFFFATYYASFYVNFVFFFWKKWREVEMSAGSAVVLVVK